LQLVFRDEREKLIQELPAQREVTKNPGSKSNKKKEYHYKIGFADLAKTIGRRWKTLDQSIKAKYEEQAAIGRQIYNEKMKAWKLQQIALGLPIKRPRKKADTTLKKAKEAPAPTTVTSMEEEQLLEPLPLKIQSVYTREEVLDGNVVDTTTCTTPFLPQAGTTYGHASLGHFHPLPTEFPQGPKSGQSFQYSGDVVRDWQRFPNTMYNDRQPVPFMNTTDSRRSGVLYLPHTRRPHCQPLVSPTNEMEWLEPLHHHHQNENWQTLYPTEVDPEVVPATTNLADELGPDGVTLLVNAFRNDNEFE
jgi:hypothetical protein